MEQVRLEVERCNQHEDLHQLEDSNPKEAKNRKRAPEAKKRQRKNRQHLDRLERIETVVDDARFQSQTSLQWPAKLSRFPFSLSLKLQNFILKCFQFLFKKQNVINADFVIALKELLRLLKDDQLENVELNHELDETALQLDSASLKLKEFEERLFQLESGISEIQRTASPQNYNALSEKQQAIEHSFNAITQRTGDVEQHLLAMGQRLNASLAAEQAAVARADSSEVKITQVEQHLLAIGQRLHLSLEAEQAGLTRIEALETKLAELSPREGNQVQTFQALSNSQSEIRQLLKDTSERHIRDLSYCKQSLVHQQEQLSILLKQLASPDSLSKVEIREKVTQIQDHNLDAFYAGFEEKFRGKREDILERLRAYLPLVEKSQKSTQGSPIVDLGCGRGEWLELLSQHNYDSAVGVDINHAFLAQCRTRSLHVVESDAIQHLTSLEASTLGGITAFHLVEHLPFPALIELLDYSLKALKSGGIAIFETPNPANLLVGSCSFYLDPTHRNPLPSPMMEFLMESRGFTDVQVLNLNQSPKPSWLGKEEDLDIGLGELLYGPQDYAVVGYKA